MNNSMNPYGGVNPLIDKMIGNAYDIVKYVAKYLREIRYVAENMEYVYTAANGNARRLNATAAGNTLLVPIPVDLDMTLLQAVTVMAVVNDTTYYFPAPDTFAFNVVTGNVAITIYNDVPALTTAEYVVVMTTYMASEE